MRRMIVGGNWKMHGTLESASALARGVAGRLGNFTGADVVVFPPALHVCAVARELEKSPVFAGGQNLHFATEGAYTGEVSASMLRDAGAAWVLVGHSERRHFEGAPGEPDALLSRKMRAALDGGLTPLLCVGETEDQREAGQTDRVLATQLAGSLAGLNAGDLARVVLAYEPVWAIGTGRTATPEIAQQAHSVIRAFLEEQFGADVARSRSILYGGSVKPSNAAELFSQPDVDGGLVGGASLNADSFAEICLAALSPKAPGA